MRTTGNKILVKPLPEEQGLLILTAPSKPLIGKVIAVGPKAEKEGYQTETTVLFNRFAGTTFEHGGEDFVALTSTDIYKIL